eukprot:NODE_2991_length_1300_cov_115.828377_g2839_i0.p1 GENE.NODE_2991_length_1300_cov_115.828377_g2839_i0~~NODE_2991_length_1300_cov_115.828377_g2839_i0.p1  ORF type:complete len:379 (-),score=6.09 NODE_2991_length_1300_cov_115.828377_g2839_i0:90-1226(-)
MNLVWLMFVMPLVWSGEQDQDLTYATTAGLCLDNVCATNMAEACSTPPRPGPMGQLSDWVYNATIERLKLKKHATPTPVRPLSSLSSQTLILLVGDSNDRNMAQTYCKLIRGVEHPRWRTSMYPDPVCVPCDPMLPAVMQIQLMSVDPTAAVARPHRPPFVLNDFFTLSFPPYLKHYGDQLGIRNVLLVYSPITWAISPLPMRTKRDPPAPPASLSHVMGFSRNITRALRLVLHGLKNFTVATVLRTSHHFRCAEGLFFTYAAYLSQYNCVLRQVSQQPHQHSERSPRLLDQDVFYDAICEAFDKHGVDCATTAPTMHLHRRTHKGTRDRGHYSEIMHELLLRALIRTAHQAFPAPLPSAPPMPTSPDCRRILSYAGP